MKYVVDVNKSKEEVKVLWFNAFWFAFLSNCWYEDLINNNLYECTYWYLTWIDVDWDG